MRKTVIVFFIILIIGVVVVSGCTKSGSTNVPTSVSPAQVQGQDPVIGVWRQLGSGWDYRIRFDADGTYTRSQSFSTASEPLTSFGTWSKVGDTTYVLTQKGINGVTSSIEPSPTTYIYSPAQGNLNIQGETGAPFIRYDGNVMTASATTKK